MYPVNGVVYALVDPRSNRPRYIGATRVSPTRRLAQHISAGRSNGRLPVARWIHTLLNEGVEPCMVIISRWQPEDRDVYDIEIEMIERFNSYGHRLLNVTAGGRGGGLGPKSAEHRANMSIALKGRKKPPRSAEWRAAHSAKMTGRRHSEETKAKIREANARQRVLVAKICRCGNEYQVIPSRLNRPNFCGPECAARKVSAQ